MNTIRRALAVLNLSANIAELVKQGRAVVQAMTNNPWFPNPTPTLPVLSATLDALEAAETAATTRAKGTVANRNVKKAAAVSGLQQEKAHVQSIADANDAEAEVIIKSAGMEVRRLVVRQKNTFEVRQGRISGLVQLIAAIAAARACYQWEWSLDQKAWTVLPATLKASTTVSNLTPGTLYYFRYRAVTKDGESDWSQVVSLLVK